MHVKQIHKPEPHVLRRAGFAGGGFKSNNLGELAVGGGGGGVIGA